MNASKCCENRPFCLHMPLMVTMIDMPEAANEALSRPRAGVRGTRPAGDPSVALSASDRRTDVGAPREVS